jgi:glycyl-tRNA synthetase
MPEETTPPTDDTRTELTLEGLTGFAKRRGFAFQASEIYGGLAGFWDYGPLGVELVNNIKASWWREFVNRRTDMVGLDTSIIQNPTLWKASGHVDEFVDPMVDDLVTRKRYRADHLADLDTTDLAKLSEALKDTLSPDGNPLTEPKMFNLMFTTNVGAVEGESTQTYLRPETAGGIFTNFKNVLDTTRQRLPFGIAQIGKSFRNELTPGEFIFRVRELEIMELEYFTKPEDAPAAFDEFLALQKKWLASIGLDPSHLHEYEHPVDGRAHYSDKTIDLEFDYPFGTKEMTGIANRTNYDLTQHAEFSGKDLRYFDEETKQHIVPYVIEPTFGLGRIALAVLCDAYHEEEVNGEKRIVLKLTPEIAPIKAAILPLSKKPELSGLAKEIFADIAGDWRIEYDETQSIGKRYRRQDEIGTPYCITVDFDSLEDKAVTVRERDTMNQDRIAITDLKAYLLERL